MNTFPQQLIASQQAGLSNALAIQGALLDGFEKLVDLNLKVLKTSFDEVSQKSQEVLKVQDAQEALNFSAGLYQPGAEKTVAYGKQVFDVVSAIQADVSRLSQEQLGQFQAQLVELIEQFGKNAPAGSESLVAGLKSALASTTSAYENMVKSARQAVEAANTNIAAATDATLKAATDATEAGKSAGRARRSAA